MTLIRLIKLWGLFFPLTITFFMFGIWARAASSPDGTVTIYVGEEKLIEALLIPLFISFAVLGQHLLLKDLKNVKRKEEKEANNESY